MAQCSGKHISKMQLFHELKQRFPNMPDRIVTHCIKKTQGDKEACEYLLKAEALLSNTKMARRPSSLYLEEKEKEGGENCRPSRSAPPTPKSHRAVIQDIEIENLAQMCSKIKPDCERPRGLPASRVITMPESKQSKEESLIKAQLAQKRNLELELEKMRVRRDKLKANYEDMKKELDSRVHLSQVVSELQRECNRLIHEVDNRDMNCPLGETDEAFYQNTETSPQVHYRLVSDLPNRHERFPIGGENIDGQHWLCNLCTFRNHPLLDQCETCDMPRLVLDGSDTQNIHIHVTHHSFPSCKVVHSWAI